MPKWAIARLTNPTKFTIAKIMVRSDECSQANSFSKRPAVPIMIRIKAVILMKFLILGFIIAYPPIPTSIFSHPPPFKEEEGLHPS
jgi:hypothetical protein